MNATVKVTVVIMSLQYYAFGKVNSEQLNVLSPATIPEGVKPDRSSLDVVTILLVV